MLRRIQSKLKVPKSQKNSFGNYNYRSLEDIQEAVKPLLAEEKLSMVISDDVVMIGDRYYIKATVRLYDDSNVVIAENTSFAREPLIKKGMDESQITGACSSYARKYALNGMFAIDDTKDADATHKAEKENPVNIAKTTTNAGVETTPPPPINKEQAKAKETEKRVSEELGSVAPPPEPATATQIEEIKRLAIKKGSPISLINKYYGIVNLQDICWTDAKHCIDELKKRKDMVK